MGSGRSLEEMILSASWTFFNRPGPPQKIRKTQILETNCLNKQKNNDYFHLSVHPIFLSKKHVNFGQGLDFLTLSQGNPNQRQNDGNRIKFDKTNRNRESNSLFYQVWFKQKQSICWLGFWQGFWPGFLPSLRLKNPGRKTRTSKRETTNSEKTLICGFSATGGIRIRNRTKNARGSLS